MQNLKVGRAAKELDTTCSWIRRQLAQARMIHQDAQLRWVTTRRGQDMETVVDHISHFFNTGTQRYQQYSVLHITPKGMRWLRALKDKKAA